MDNISQLVMRYLPGAQAHPKTAGWIIALLVVVVLFPTAIAGWTAAFTDEPPAQWAVDRVEELLPIPRWLLGVSYLFLLFTTVFFLMMIIYYVLHIHGCSARSDPNEPTIENPGDVEIHAKRSVEISGATAHATTESWPILTGQAALERFLAWKKETGDPIVITPSSPIVSISPTVTILPLDDSGWAHLEVKNNGVSDRFKVQVEILRGSGRKDERAYPAPRRGNGTEWRELVQGEKDAVNIASEATREAMNEAKREIALAYDLTVARLRSGNKGSSVVRFYTANKNATGSFDRPIGWGKTIHLHISVLSPTNSAWEADYDLRLTASGRLRFSLAMDTKSPSEA